MRFSPSPFAPSHEKNKAAPAGAALMGLIIALILVLAGRLGFLAALHAGALVVLLLPQIGQDAGLGAAALESLKSVIQRLVLLDMDFRHFIPSLQIRLAAL